VDKGLGNVVFSETPSRFLSPAGVLGAPIADLVGQFSRSEKILDILQGRFRDPLQGFFGKEGLMARDKHMGKGK